MIMLFFLRDKITLVIIVPVPVQRFLRPLRHFESGEGSGDEVAQSGRVCAGSRLSKIISNDSELEFIYCKL